MWTFFLQLYLCPFAALTFNPNIFLDEIIDESEHTAFIRYPVSNLQIQGGLLFIIGLASSPNICLSRDRAC
jgi:hypothetical protein